MGSFDTLVLPEEKCPVCKKYSTLTFQTKAFDRGLRTLRPPSHLAETGIEHMFKEINAILTNTIGTCEKCKSRLYADFFIYHSTIISPLIITNDDRASNWASCLVDYLTYFINFEAKKHKVKVNG